MFSKWKPPLFRFGQRERPTDPETPSERNSVANLPKLTAPEISETVEFTYGNTWERENGDGYARLLIGAEAGEIPIILELCRSMTGPFGILIVLTVPRMGHKVGRYQSPDPLDFEDLEVFLYTFQELFEGDGRLAVWVVSRAGEGQFIFDTHNLIYAYGDLDSYTAALGARGFREGKLAIPSPHTHHYHDAFDAAEEELVQYWNWRVFDLEPYDD